MITLIRNTLLNTNLYFDGPQKLIRDYSKNEPMESDTKNKVKTDLEIAQGAEMQHITSIASKIDVGEDRIEMYGKYKAKLPLELIDESKIEQSNLILVTATPTPAGEAKLPYPLV